MVNVYALPLLHVDLLNLIDSMCDAEELKWISLKYEVEIYVCATKWNNKKKSMMKRK